ncbi:MAG: chemotaxis response regulator protein-glutamate methylesterase [Hydrogenophilus sp.]|nr:chemotaxis response regulator protein-glutamate methylesterase [Hydrogenophilus sp.]
MSTQTPIRVVSIDDSAVVRQAVKSILEGDPEFELLGVAPDPLFAKQLILNRAWPDVFLLDIEMPRQDGLSFLREVMENRPTPVVVCSSLTGAGSPLAIEALEAGAVAIITKPKMGVGQFLSDSARELKEALKSAAAANRKLLRPFTPPPPVVAKQAQMPISRREGGERTTPFTTTDRVIAIGASTGGTTAIETILTALPAETEGIVIVQHMPERFTALFADRLNQICAIEVREAKDGDRVRPGLALIAPGARQMQLKRSGAQYVVEVRDGPPVNRHKPSVDVLFKSVAAAAGGNALGILLTGMGDDGARGLLAMREAGALTIAEDESTCVVFGMPRVAIELGAAIKVLPLPRISAELMLFSKGGLRY